MFFCTAILLFVSDPPHILPRQFIDFQQSYLVGLWFSLRTHASQIWQNPQQLMHSLELPGPTGPRLSVYQKLVPSGITPTQRLHTKTSNLNSEPPSRSQTPVPRVVTEFATPRPQQASGSSQATPRSPSITRRVSYAPAPTVAHQNQQQQPGYTPLMESVDHAIKNNNMPQIQLSESMTADDFTRAVAVATVSALRHQQNHSFSPSRARISGLGEVEADGGGHGGHDAPSWTRTFSACVLLGCTALYAIIAGGCSASHFGGPRLIFFLLRNPRRCRRCRFGGLGH